MSSYLDDTAKELVGASEPTETVETQSEPVETVETPAETVETPADPVDNQPDPAPDPEPESETVSEPVETEKPAPKPKKDLSGLTKAEKAEFSFRRQLERQKAKHDAEVEELKNSWHKEFEELKNSLKPKEQPKLREDFSTDDDYINYLLDQKMAAKDADLSKKEQAAAAQKAIEDEAAAAQKEITDRFISNCTKTFSDENEYAAFAAKVNKAMANKLGEMLDEVPTVRDYLFQNPNGPLVLNEMLSKQDAFVRIMSRASNPIEATIEMHEMAKELRNAQKVETVDAEPAQPKQLMPNIGKPGKGNGSTAPDVFSNDQSLLDYIRGRK